MNITLALAVLQAAATEISLAPGQIAAVQAAIAALSPNAPPTPLATLVAEDATIATDLAALHAKVEAANAAAVAKATPTA